MELGQHIYNLCKIRHMYKVHEEDWAIQNPEYVKFLDKRIKELFVEYNKEYKYEIR